MDQPAAPSLRHTALLLALVAAVAGWLCFDRLGTPQTPVWDEAYYLPTTARYHQGLTQYATHAPLGTMLIAAGDSIAGRNQGADWRSIGAERKTNAAAMPADFDYAGPRLAPALFGTAAALLFAVLMLHLTGSVFASALLSLLVLADTALLVQFRSAQLDPFQLTFALAAVLAALRAQRRQDLAGYALFGLFVAMAALVRINALMLGAMVPVMLWPLIRFHRWRAVLKHCLAGGGAALLAALLVMGAWLSVSKLPPDAATPVGQRDLAFDAPNRAAIYRTGTWSLADMPDAAAGMQRAMAHDLAATPASDPHGSHPWQWLLGRRMILYNADRTSGTLHSIALVPNQAAWLISLLGVLTSLLPGRLRQSPPRALLLAGWLGSMALLQWLDAVRVVYSYHYFIPLLLGHAMAALEWRHHGLPRRPAAALAVVVAGFGAIAWPLATYRPAPDWICEARLAQCGPTQP